jgi:hypothetical protein
MIIIAYACEVDLIQLFYIIKQKEYHHHALWSSMFRRIEIASFFDFMKIRLAGVPGGGGAASPHVGGRTDITNMRFSRLSLKKNMLLDCSSASCFDGNARQLQSAP